MSYKIIVANFTDLYSLGQGNRTATLRVYEICGAVINTTQELLQFIDAKRMIHQLIYLPRYPNFRYKLSWMSDFGGCSRENIGKKKKSFTLYGFMVRRRWKTLTFLALSFIYQVLHRLIFFRIPLTTPSSISLALLFFMFPILHLLYLAPPLHMPVNHSVPTSTVSSFFCLSVSHHLLYSPV